MEEKVLDKGFVRVEDHFGDDFSAVQAARVSYGKGLTDYERDKLLLEYLMEKGHTSCFEHMIIKFHIKLPIFVMRQLVRHRIASINERSGRYTQFQQEWYIPSFFRKQDNKDRQRSLPSEEEYERAKDIFDKSFTQAYDSYAKLLELGVAREQARLVLPTSMYTEIYWTINLRSLMNFLNLRADSHAQFEMQEYACAIARLFERLYPLTYNAFIKYVYKGDVL